MPSRVLNVLVLDDSAMVRKVLSSLLSQEPDIKVVTAATGQIAFNKMKRERPDVIVLDLEMPTMDGLTFLQKVMEEDPIPVVICSDQAARGSEKALKALELGAVEIINKPKIGVEEFLFESAVLIIDRVKAAAQAKVRARLPMPSSPVRFESKPGYFRELGTPPISGNYRDVVVCIGASTGGTEALAALLESMPKDTPPIAIVQHMPAGFTAAFAARLNAISPCEVIEARNGDLLYPGRALVAPGDKHMILRKGQRGLMAETVEGPLISRHRPSCDVLFKSAARAMGDKAVGVVLTGMGSDGAEGILEMKNAGARTIAQDKASCVVYGMPKVAVQLGAIDEVRGLRAIPSAILWLAGYISNP